jgi:myosin heavy subunit
MILGNPNVGLSLLYPYPKEGDRHGRARTRYQTLSHHATTLASRLRELEIRRRPAAAWAAPQVAAVGANNSIQMQPLTSEELQEGYTRLRELTRLEQQDDDDDEKEQWSMKWNAWIAANENGTAAPNGNGRVTAIASTSSSRSSTSSRSSSSSSGDSESKSVAASTSWSSSSDTKSETKKDDDAKKTSSTNVVNVALTWVHRPRRRTWLYYAANYHLASVEVFRWLLYGSFVTLMMGAHHHLTFISCSTFR